jgi:urease accessory protein
MAMPLKTPMNASLPGAPDTLERARGRLALTVRRREGAHSIGDLRQEGCGRLLFPARSHLDPVEAVVVNTAGGVTGGDRFAVSVKVREQAAVVVTTQACEKVYRSGGGAARISSTLTAAAGARLTWIPQETILFDGCRLERRLDAEIAPDAVFLACEAVILGRAAMGETLATAALRDSWRIRRGGRLVFAEETACDGGWADAFAARAALGPQAGAFATLVLASGDAQAKLDPARTLIDACAVEGGASLVDGLLVIRILAGAGLALRQAMLPLLELLMDARPPRIWTT